MPAFTTDGCVTRPDEALVAGHEARDVDPVLAVRLDAGGHAGALPLDVLDDAVPDHARHVGGDLDHVAHRDVGLEAAVAVQRDHVVVAVDADVGLAADEGPRLQQRHEVTRSSCHEVTLSR